MRRAFASQEHVPDELRRTSRREPRLARRGSGKHLVIAIFDTPSAGEVAARTLTRETRAEGRSGSIGMLMLDDTGKIAVGKLGARTTDGDIGVGAVLDVIAAALTGGVMPRRASFFDARSELSTDDVARLAADIEAGQAAVAVLDQQPLAERAVVELTRLGAKAEVHRLTGRALQQAASAPRFIGS
jgi:hypothetical protein